MSFLLSKIFVLFHYFFSFFFFSCIIIQLRIINSREYELLFSNLLILLIDYPLFNVVFKFSGTQVRAQDEEGADGIDANAEELCQDRPGDEYFRLNVDGDCRDVVR